MFEYPAAVGKDFRDCARRVCKELGFDSIGLQGVQERVVVGNLIESVDKLHADLADSIAPEVQFRSDISRLEKEVIKREARLKGYLIVEDDSGLKVSRLSVLQISEKEDPVKELSKLSDEVFAQYATGRAGSHIYMRRSDVLSMLKDLPAGRSEALAKELQQAYDDTLHLQVELTKASNGLSKRFFSVFLDKAMQKVGWYPSPEILEALHHRREEELEMEDEEAEEEKLEEEDGDYDPEDGGGEG